MVVGAFTVETQVVVVGGGPAGIAAACRTAALGLETTLVCAGALPCATWRSGALVAEEILRAAGSLGASADAPAVRRRAQQALAARSSAVASRLDALGVRIVTGRARFDDSRQLTIEGAQDVPRLRFRRAILAIGAGPGVAPDPSALLEDAFAAPRAVTVAAASPVIAAAIAAVALARAAAVLRHRVTLTLPGGAMLPGADEDLLALVMPRLERELAGLRLGAAPPRGSSGAEFVFGAGAAAPSDLGLDRTGVAMDAHGSVQADEDRRTADPRILAAGAVTGAATLEAAIHQARAAAETAAGAPGGGAPAVLPWLARTDPTVGWCGLTEGDARSAGHACAVHAASGDDAGSPESPGPWRVKLLVEPESELVLGAGAAGPRADEVIACALLAIEMGAVLTDLAAIAAPAGSAAALLGAAARARPDRSGRAP